MTNDIEIIHSPLEQRASVVGVTVEMRGISTSGGLKIFSSNFANGVIAACT